MTSPITTSTAENTNGTRQPHAWNCSGVVTACTTAKNAVDSSIPAAEPTCVNEPNSPRSPEGACSTDSTAEPPHSIPAESPCRIRQATSSTTAAQPIRPKPGSRPIAVVASPMVSKDATSSALRPIRSPRWPAMIPPRGRKKNAIAKVANEAITAPTPEPCGKK